MKKEELRNVSIYVNGLGVLTGKFHRWFDKRWEDGTSMLYAIVELDSDGSINSYDTDTCEITFTKPNLKK